MKISDYWQHFYSSLGNAKKRKAIGRWLRMHFYIRFPRNSPEQIQKLHKELAKDSRWKTDFIVCTIIACLIASFGLLSNSTAVIIGAMLVAPLMLPLRGLAFSACEGDFKLFSTAFMSIVGATVVSLLLSIFIADLISFTEFGSEIIARTQPNLIDLGIAVTAGAMSGFGKIRKGISDTLAGTAIAVALMPPLCVVGISLSANNMTFAQGAFLLYVTNLLGITFACMIVFIFAGYTKINKALGWAGLLTLALFIPLGSSFFRLIDQQRIEANVKKKLTEETITIGQDTEDVQVKVIWTTKIPTVYVSLQTNKEINSKQVGLVEKYLNSRLEKEFRLILNVTPRATVTSSDPEPEEGEITPIETEPKQKLILQQQNNVDIESDSSTNEEDEPDNSLDDDIIDFVHPRSIN